MPLCTFQTNLPQEKIPDDFDIELSQIVAKVLSKPIDKITVVIEPGMQMCRNGTREPTCMFVIWSINVFSEEKNPSYSGPFYQVISEKLGIPTDRIVIVYHDLKREQLAKLD